MNNNQNKNNEKKEYPAYKEALAKKLAVSNNGKPPKDIDIKLFADNIANQANDFLVNESLPSNMLEG